MDFSHVGDSRCHFGDDRTWCLVHRCPALRQEAHRYSGIVGGYFYLPLKADHPFSLFRERAIRPSGVVRMAKLDSQSPPRTKGLANKDGNGIVQQISASGPRENTTPGP